jgi:hypothetical protein
LAKVTWLGIVSPPPVMRITLGLVAVPPAGKLLAHSLLLPNRLLTTLKVTGTAPTGVSCASVEVTRLLWLGTLTVYVATMGVGTRPPYWLVGALKTL